MELAALGGLWILFLLVLAVLWALLPFAVFGFKSLLRDGLVNQQRMLENQEREIEGTKALLAELDVNNKLLKGFLDLQRGRMGAPPLPQTRDN